MPADSNKDRDAHERKGICVSQSGKVPCFSGTDNKDLVADAQTLQEENLSEKGSVESARRLDITDLGKIVLFREIVLFLGRSLQKLLMLSKNWRVCKFL